MRAALRRSPGGRRLEPPLSGPLGHTGRWKPEEGREGARRAANAARGRSSFLLAPIDFIGCGLPTPAFSERVGSLGRKHSWRGQRQLHPKASQAHFGLGATVPSGDGEGQRHLFHLQSAPPRPPPKPEIKGCTVLLSKQVHSRAPRSRGGSC